jgi:hypothetical protein
MTSHLDDEALSAALDDCGSLRDQAHLNRCPVCAGRLDALKTMSQSVGTPVSMPSPAQVDRAVAAAVRASLGTRLSQPGRNRHNGGGTTSRRFGAILAAAAAVLLVGGGIVALTRAVGHSSSSKTSSAQSRPLPALGSTVPVAGAASGSAGATSTAAPPGPLPLELGAYTDIDTLRSALRGVVAQRTGAATAVSGSAGACQSRPTPPKVIALVQWRGQPAVVFVYDEGGPSPAIAVVMSTQGCGQLISFPL